VVKLIETTFGLGALADLPDEQKGLAAGEFAGKFNLGPQDGDNGVSDLLDAFDYGRLSGAVAPLAASYAYVPPYFISHLPAQTGIGCRAIGVTPVDYLRGINNVIPADFNPRPGTDPTEASVKAINTRSLVNGARDIDD
jgi:phospholipase C